MIDKAQSSHMPTYEKKGPSVKPNDQIEPMKDELHKQ